MEIRIGSADFSAPLRGSGPRTATQAIVFPRAVNQAAVGLIGYSAAFGDNDDHNIGKLQIQVEGTITSNVVNVTATLGLRDWSGDWDDDYQGTVEFTVLADLVSATAPPPRGDMIIVDMEANQAVQFFRAARFLDASNALPDNAISLVESKATGFRMYVDYDAFSGLPPVSHLTGQMTVKTGSTTLTLDPINSGGAIVPLADSAINQAVADNTLNFMLEGAWCVGTVTVTVQVWDAADSSTKSAQFTRTLTFVPVAPLDIYIVGVHYTAQGLDLTAPTQSDIVTSAMARLRATYPVGEVSINGYSTLDYGENVNFTIGTQGGCGDGMNDLLDKLSDMQGGSSDVYAGFLPDLNLIQTPGSNIGGCGTVSQAAIFVDQVGDVPHEVGHALGRQHAPCNAGKCNPPPANVDDHYPQYGAFPAGSIGVFGFDPTTNTVFDPAKTADFMAYWGPQWVSAYTYMALGGAFPAQNGGPGAGLASGHALGNVPVETLMLKLVVTRERQVRRLPSFHFESLPRTFANDCSDFTVELLDACRRTLVCAPLDCGCQQAGCHCWPRNMRGAVPYPAAARWLLVYENDRKIHEECIPARPPRIKLAQPESTERGTLLAWEPLAQEDALEAECCAPCCDALLYLVHWFDEEDGIWRGIAPRGTARTALVPANLYRRADLRVRVLASCGVATGYTEVTIPRGGKQGGGNGGDGCNNPPTAGRPDTNATLVLEGYDAKARGPSPGTQVLRVTAIGELGKSVEVSRVRWYGERGEQLAAGSQLDLRRLPRGAQTVRVSMRTADGGWLQQSWRLERTST